MLIRQHEYSHKWEFLVATSANTGLDFSHPSFFFPEKKTKTAVKDNQTEE